jgi:hypothetical protein
VEQLGGRRQRLGAALASGSLGQCRRASGWDEYAGDPRYANEHWRMEGVFLRARELATFSRSREKVARSAG